MLFHSPIFLLAFLPVALAGYGLVKKLGPTPGKVWLIGASMVFYASWRWEYLPLMMLSIVMNFGVAEGLYRMDGQSRRRWLLTVGIIANVLLLGYFKYKNFFLQSVSAVSGWVFDLQELALPLAISFYTFTQTAYLVDIYRDRRDRRGFLDYCLFIMFFPHLVAGPILRHWEFFPQLHKGVPKILARQIFPGLVLLLLGIAKKILFAENAAAIASPVFAAGAGQLTTFDAWLGSVAFALQVYFDFSAYSDMALGLGLLFGIRLPVNFLSPFRSTSVIDFWRHWHITLGRYLRDYVYFPLGGSRNGTVRTMLNLFATMLVSGIWHGAGWTFIIFGVFQGIALALNHLTRKIFGEPGKSPVYVVVLKWSATFLFTVLTLVYFRSTTVAQAHGVFGAMFGWHGITVPTYHEASYGMLKNLGVLFQQSSLPELGRSQILFIGFLFFWVLCLPNTFVLLKRWRPAVEKIPYSSRFSLRPTWWVAVGLGIVLFFVVKSFFIARPSEFIYFQF